MTQYGLRLRAAENPHHWNDYFWPLVMTVDDSPHPAHRRRNSYCVMPNEISHEIITESMSQMRHHFRNAEV
jgi:hypothetical protein